VKNESLERIKKRLAKGQTWLISHYDAYMDDEMDPEEWYRAFDLWDGLDYLIRWEGCPVGGCHYMAPIGCRGCANDL